MAQRTKMKRLSDKISFTCKHEPNSMAERNVEYKVQIKMNAIVK